MNKRNIKRTLLLLLVCILVATLSGCAALNAALSKTKGKLIGQHFEITAYDHFANKTLTVYGSKVTVGLLTNSANNNVDSTGFKSEVLDISINGNQILQVGNTVIFAEDGLDMVTDFEVPTDITLKNGGGFVPLDRFINNIQNSIGKSKTIIISSQMGVPLGVYQGEEVYVTVPSDLPKMTRLNIDGKSLYIHRANYLILDTELMK